MNHITNPPTIFRVFVFRLGIEQARFRILTDTAAEVAGEEDRYVAWLGYSVFAKFISLDLRDMDAS